MRQQLAEETARCGGTQIQVGAATAASACVSPPSTASGRSESDEATADPQGPISGGCRRTAQTVLKVRLARTVDEFSQAPRDALFCSSHPAGLALKRRYAAANSPRPAQSGCALVHLSHPTLTSSRTSVALPEPSSSLFPFHVAFHETDEPLDPVAFRLSQTDLRVRTWSWWRGVRDDRGSSAGSDRGRRSRRGCERSGGGIWSHDARPDWTPGFHSDRSSCSSRRRARARRSGPRASSCSTQTRGEPAISSITTDDLSFQPRPIAEEPDVVERAGAGRSR